MTNVICAIIKNEQRYIKEWVEYHFNVGFDNIYLFEDYGSESHCDVLCEYIEQKRVFLTNLSSTKLPFDDGNHKSGIRTQLLLYNWFLDSCIKEKIQADWIAFIDVDEFITFDNGWNLQKLEQSFFDYGGVRLCWVMYGANGHLKRPIGNVVDNYTSHMPYGFILNLKRLNHKCLVNVKRQVEKRFPQHNIHDFERCVYTNYSFSSEDYVDCFCKCHINHYYTKSWEDYCERMQRRGNMSNNIRSYDDFFDCSPEFADKELEMLDDLRYNSKNLDTMWISRKHKIISGGNLAWFNKINRIGK